MPDAPPSTTPSSRLLIKWGERARANQLSHWESARSYDLKNTLLGGVAAVFSAVVGSVVFATLEKRLELPVQLAVGAASVLAAILVALQTFLRYSEQAEKHRGTASGYAAIRRRIEALLTVEGANSPHSVAEIEKELNRLADSAPTVPQGIWRKTERQMKAHPSFIASLEAAEPAPRVQAAGPAPGDPYTG